jgi:predicted HD phosphohydrolase
MIGRSPLLRSEWRHIETVALEAFSPAEWDLLNAQRRAYMAAEQAGQVLRLLGASAEDATFGYLVNNYRHCLQSATMALRDRLDEETVVVCLLHDVGFITCPTTHGELAAALLGPYVSEANEWMLRHHQVFQDYHLHADPTVDRHARERWRGHPHFEWTATFVERYDQAANDPGYDCAPLEAFEPMVRRVFSRPPRRGSRTDEVRA